MWRNRQLWSYRIHIRRVVISNDWMKVCGALRAMNGFLRKKPGQGFTTVQAATPRRGW